GSESFRPPLPCDSHAGRVWGSPAVLKREGVSVTRTTRRLLILPLLFVALVAGVPAGAKEHNPSSDVVYTWNEVAFATARLKNLSDAKAARLYAMVNVAMYDAVNGIASRLGHVDRDQALVDPTGAPTAGDPGAAAAAAAHAVLLGVFPDQAAVYNAQLAADLAALGSGPQVEAGQTWGALVGGEVLTAPAGDGVS